ncbi:MAG: hypothetical protein WBA10_10190 [Elainellaceae cyanobacterium]
MIPRLSAAIAGFWRNSPRGQHAIAPPVTPIPDYSPRYDIVKGCPTMTAQHYGTASTGQN